MDAGGRREAQGCGAAGRLPALSPDGWVGYQVCPVCVRVSSGVWFHACPGGPGLCVLLRLRCIRCVPFRVLLWLWAVRMRASEPWVCVSPMLY